MVTRRTLVKSALAFTTWRGVAQAQQPWPARPIRLICPLSAGGPTDALARQVAKQLGTSLGQSLVVENVLGAAGQVGLDQLRRSPADGYTIGISANTIQAIAPHLRKLPYDTIKDFTALGGLAGFPYALMVSAKSPINSVQDLVARAKAEPGKLVAGSAGVGTGTELTIAMLAQHAGLSFNQVNYKGSAPVTQDLLAGNIDFTMDVISSTVPMWKQGMVKVLATTGAKRHKVIKDAPAMNEIYPGFEFSAWFAMYGPADLPAAVTHRISDELLAIQKTPEFQAFIENRGLDAMPASAEQLAKSTRDEFAKWGALIAKMPKRES
ncbi:Argininosuccinate lyase [Variovorax sp. SRS16]|uniref:Bug family tripartite tricarboxylate transporter substrate binding protein n=1 Tax=Variovorax sp. SRS16 TaxID=282217 RepID=UPI0013183042|nr:tripartite tricarboxylate transporter substrate binding protein [Variovorax sp. SRS16]VTU29955.1 Argininosuccinate lyase [Variovorax sp. SRS16]